LDSRRRLLESTLMPPIIQVEQLVKRYRKAEQNAVDGVSFEVAPDSFFALLGPNGAGKTTAISILTTTLTPTSGRVMVAGHDVVQDPDAVRRQLGIIFQKPSLDLNLTAEENVRLHAVLYGLYPWRPFYRFMPAAYRKQVDVLAAVVGLTSAEMGQAVRTFSGGMKRKLEIVRSLIHRPRVLFLDEPTTGLDPASRRGLWEYLGQVRAAGGTTVFLTTHYLEEAEDADQICILNHGRVVSMGTAETIKGDLVQNWVRLDAADRDALCAELAALGHQHERDENGVTVPVEAAGVHGLLRAIATPLQRVTTHTPTLEEAYLEILERPA
jgi:ABC-2 type transport system ATP-binding protein